VLVATLQGQGRRRGSSNEIKEVIRLDGQQTKGTFKDLTAKWARPALVVALILAVGQQFSGVNAVNNLRPRSCSRTWATAHPRRCSPRSALGVVKVLFTVAEMFRGRPVGSPSAAAGRWAC